ncbi:MAG: hypothetical protein AAF490_14960 [Chloroflexota bacterium]
MDIQIKPVTTNKAFEAIMQISAKAWGAPSLDDSVPSHTLRAIADNKGTVLMAWDNHKPIGFCFSIFSFTGTTISDPNLHFYHYSHQAGVLPEYRGWRVGEKLKWAQREAVLDQGVNLITWTFDPLQTLNAKLNIHKLGATSSTFKRHYYGDMDDDLNRGLPTDRFKVSWWIGSDWVTSHANQTYQSPSLSDSHFRYTQINTAVLKNNRLTPKATHTESWSNDLILTIPKNFTDIHKADLELAIAWKLHVRELFELAFERGYTAVDLLTQNDRCHYLLQKNWDS